MPDVPYGLCHCGCGQEPPLVRKTRRGVEKGQPRNYCQGHGKRKGVDYVTEERGHSTPCWVWQRGHDSSGYGCMWYEQRLWSSHRAYYTMANGPIPEGLHVDHLCRVRACCNPDHLELVTQTENCRRGNNTKLTIDDVRAIKTSVEDPKILGERYGIDRHYVYALRRGSAWSEV